MKYDFRLLEDGQRKDDWYELESHQCTREELGLEGSDHKFWPAKKSQENTLEALSSFLFCLDASDLRLQGSWTSEN